MERGGVASLAVLITAVKNFHMLLYGKYDDSGGGIVEIGEGGIDGIMIPPSIIIIRVSFGGGLGGTTKTTSSGAQRRGMAILGIDLTLTGE